MTSVLAIDGPAGRLEAVRDEPPLQPHAIAVLCHPHPLYGGNLDDAVLEAALQALLPAGIACVRFNFRGVGGSAGEHDGGRGETDDALAVLRQCADTDPALPRLLLGYSFGASVAWRVGQVAEADRGALARLLLVAPVVGRMSFDGAAPSCPVHAFAGAGDAFVSLPALEAWANALAPRPSIVAIGGADHFFAGRHRALTAAIADAVG